MKKLLIAVLLLTAAVFLVGGGNSDNRFLASLGLSRDLRTAGSWFELENFTAVNLAGEGLEAFRAVRNINLVKFDNDPEHCWNMLPENPAGAKCESPNLVKAGFYAVRRAQGVDLWFFDYIGSNPENALKISGTGHGAKGGTDDGANERYRVDFITDSSGGYPSTILARPENDAVFYRMVEVQYEDGASEDQKGLQQIMKITATVQWASGGGISETFLSTFLTNH